MSLQQIPQAVTKTLHNSGSVAKHGTKAILRDPQIMLYPFLAGAFILLTLPTVNGLVFGIWDKLAPHSVFSADQHIPHKLRIFIGLVTFSYFYVSVVTTYFICAVSATVLHKLDDNPTTLFHGLKEVGRHFLRVTHFAFLSIFFAPLAIVVQWRKLPRGIVGVLGSAIGLHTAQMAPAILHKHNGVAHTIRDSVDTLGILWKEGLVIKLFTWSLAILLTSVGFLPKLVEHYWFDGNTAHLVGWLATTLLAVSFWVLTKVLGAVYISVLYHRASKKN